MAVAVVLAIAALTIFTARPADPDIYPVAPGQAAAPAFLVDNGFHSDLVLPRDRLAGSGGPSARAASGLPPGPWISIGWGDERFYKESGVSLHRLADAMRCLFWPDNRQTVVRMEALPASPDRLYRASSVTRLKLSDAGFRRMIRRLDRSFLTVSGAPLTTAPSPLDPSGVYFRSKERINLLHLCNHWTADLLHAAGLPTTPVLDTATFGLKLDLKLRAGVERRAGAGSTG